MDNHCMQTWPAVLWSSLLLFLLSFISVKRRWKSMVGSPCGLATDNNPVKTMEMSLCYGALLQDTQSGKYKCVLTYWTQTHTNSSHCWLLQREIAIRVRLGFNWSRSQFNVRQGLAVIGRREEGKGRVLGRRYHSPWCQNQPPSLTGILWCDPQRCEGASGKALVKSWTGERSDIKLNLIPISLWRFGPDLGYF